MRLVFPSRKRHLHCTACEGACSPSPSLSLSSVGRAPGWSLVTFHFLQMAAAAGAGGGGGAAQGVPAPKTVAELRKEAEAAGAPAELPDSTLSHWLFFSGGPPALALAAKGLFLPQLDSHAVTYRGYFSPVCADGKLKQGWGS